MFQHPDLTMSLAIARRSELIAEADRARVLSSLQGRRGRRARHARSGRSPA